MSASPLSALLAIALCAGLTGCASAAPASQDEPSLHVSETEKSACFELEREPGEQGGLRIPRQTVCPPVTTEEEDKE